MPLRTLNLSWIGFCQLGYFETKKLLCGIMLSNKTYHLTRWTWKMMMSDKPSCWATRHSASPNEDNLTRVSITMLPKIQWLHIVYKFNWSRLKSPHNLKNKPSLNIWISNELELSYNMRYIPYFNIHTVCILIL